MGKRRGLIRLRRIYNFLCSMLDYISVPHVFIMILYHFGMIYGTNLLTRCPVPVHVFCCLFFRKVVRVSFSESSENLRELFLRRNKDGARMGAAGGPQPLDATQARPKCWQCRGPTWATPLSPRVTLSPINCLRRGNPRYPDHIFQNTSEATVVVNPRSGGF